MKPQNLVRDRGIMRQAAAGDGPFLSIVDSLLTTAGAGTVLAALMATGLLMRTGPVGAYIDTLDTAANLNLAFPALDLSESIDFIYSNNVAFAATIAVGAGITAKSAVGNLVIPASSSKTIHIEKTGAATYDLYVL